MARWRVDFIGKVLFTLGAVEAPDEKAAIAQAAADFRVPPARRNQIVVTRTQAVEKRERSAHRPAVRQPEAPRKAEHRLSRGWGK